MATRFGGQSPFQVYIMKVRWVVGGLLSVIILLAGAMIYVTAGAKEEAKAVSASTSDTLDAPYHFVDVYTAGHRIEAGTRLEPHHFAKTSLRTDQLPLGAIRSEDAASVFGSYAARLLQAGNVLSYEDVQSDRPVRLFIPEGYRAVTLKGDERELVDGFVTPNSRVDVLWRHQNARGRTQIKPIVRFAKVISVGGELKQTERSNVGRQPTTVTLLVTARDAQKLELARSLGSISLVLLGGVENGTLDRSAEVVTEGDLFDQQAEPEEQLFEGTAYVANTQTGGTDRYVLANGRWSRD